MSYCRWQNTLKDFQDCMGDLEDRRELDGYSDEPKEALSKAELAACLNLYHEALTFVESIDEDELRELMELQ